MDWVYLQGLSDDAVPVLAKLPAEVAGCALMGRDLADDDWLEWNFGRHRAEPLIRADRPAGRSDLHRNTFPLSDVPARGHSPGRNVGLALVSLADD